MKKKTRKSNPARSMKTLPPKKLNAKTAKGVKGGSAVVEQGSMKASGKGIEITDYGFGVSMPVSTSRSD